MVVIIFFYFFLGGGGGGEKGGWAKGDDGSGELNMYIGLYYYIMNGSMQFQLYRAYSF